MQGMDHWARVYAAIQGENTDSPPVALWRHFPQDDLSIDKLVRHTLDWQNKWHFDLVKFMPTGTFSAEAWGAVSAYEGAANGSRSVIEPAVRQIDDWNHIHNVDTRRGAFGRQNEAIGYVARALRGTVPILQTVFSPLTTARKMSSDRLYADIRCAPDIIEKALDVITETTIDYALQAIEAGAHGIFLATQQASSRLLTVDEYERFGKRYDLKIFEALRGKAKINMLHAHGDDIMTQQLSTYPADMFNWHDRLAQPTLQEALGLFKGMLVGGIDEHRTLLHGTDDDIADEIHEAINQTDGRRLMIGPGCVVPVSVSDRAIAAVLRTVRETRHEAAYA